MRNPFYLKKGQFKIGDNICTEKIMIAKGTKILDKFGKAIPIEGVALIFGKVTALYDKHATVVVECITTPDQKVVVELPYHRQYKTSLNYHFGGSNADGFSFNATGKMELLELDELEEIGI